MHLLLPLQGQAGFLDFRYKGGISHLCMVVVPLRVQALVVPLVVLLLECNNSHQDRSGSRSRIQEVEVEDGDKFSTTPNSAHQLTLLVGELHRYAIITAMQILFDLLL